MKKIQYCKCGHELEADHKKEIKVLGFKTKTLDYCSKCCCHGYISRSYPDKATTIGTYALVGMFTIIIGIVIFFVYSSSQHYSELLSSDPDHLLNKPIATYHTVFKWIPVAGALLCMYLGRMPLYWYLDYRRMKNTPVKLTESQGSKEE